MDLPKGFTTEAEQLAKECRDELKIGLYRRLAPLGLAKLLDIRVIALSELASQGDFALGVEAHVALFSGPEKEAFSAATIFFDDRRAILHNDSHSLARQASNLSHELAHGLLLHPPQVAIDDFGCRNWDQQIEDEATYLSGTLLIPGDAARSGILRGLSIEKIADRYGCSVQMARMRVNQTGASKLIPKRIQTS